MKILRFWAAATVLGLAVGTHALPLRCTASLSDGSTANARCPAGQFEASVFSPMRVSVDEVLGFNLWIADQGAFYSDLSTATGGGLTGNQVSGVWMLDNLRSLLADAMLVHPTRSDRGSSWTYISHLLDARDLTHHPANMFAEPQGDVVLEPVSIDADGTGGEGANVDDNDSDGAATSDEDANGRDDEGGPVDQDEDNHGPMDYEYEGEPGGEVTEIPEPTMLALLGIGLLVLALARGTHRADDYKRKCI